MNIFDIVQSLKFPLGEYIVVGSGPMAARGIRNFQDVDIVAKKELWDRLKTEDWEECFFGNRRYLKRGVIEVFSDFKCGSYQPETNNLIAEAEMIQGIPFLKLDDLVIFKKELGREKDIQDIALIEKYLKEEV